MKETKKMEKLEFEYPIVRRFFAWVIDWVLLGILTSILVVIIVLLIVAVVMVIGELSALAELSLIILFISGFIFSILFSTLYFVFFETSKYRGTLGKYWLGLELVDASGFTVRWWVSLGRFILPILVYLFFDFVFGFIEVYSGMGYLSIWWWLVYVGSYLTVFFSRTRRSLWDMLFGTLVIRRDKGDKGDKGDNKSSMSMPDEPTTT